MERVICGTPDDEHRVANRLDHPTGHTAHHEAGQAAAPVGGHDDQGIRILVCEAGDVFHGRAFVGGDLDRDG